jgi:hypothetical protein
MYLSKMPIPSVVRQMILASSLLTVTSAYLTPPPDGAPVDPNTISDCSYWQVAKATDSCASIANDNFITVAMLASYVCTSSLNHALN